MTQWWLRHSMPPAWRWGGFNLDYVTIISSTEKVVVAHGLWRPEQAKQMKERRSYSLKQQLSPGKVPFSCQLRRQGPSRSGPSEPLYLNAPIWVPWECVHTPFYTEHDVTPLVLCWNVQDLMAGKPLIGWDNPSNGRCNFIPNHLLCLANDTRLEPYSFINCIPSTTGGNVEA